MTEEQVILLNNLKENLTRLKAYSSALQHENKTLRDSNQMLNQKLMDLQKEYSELQQDHTIVKLSKAFSGSVEEKKGLKKKIGLMVRDIDKCIELLNE